MRYKFLRLHRPETGTNLTVLAPVEFGGMNEELALYLDQFVQCNYPDFHISEMWTEDQKLMFETA